MQEGIIRKTDTFVFSGGDFIDSTAKNHSFLFDMLSPGFGINFDLLKKSRLGFY